MCSVNWLIMQHYENRLWLSTHNVRETTVKSIPFLLPPRQLCWRPAPFFWLASSTRRTKVTVEHFVLTGQWIIKWGVCKSQKCLQTPAIHLTERVGQKQSCVNSSTGYMPFNFVLHIDVFFYIGDLTRLPDTVYRKYLQLSHKNMAAMKNGLC